MRLLNAVKTACLLCAITAPLAVHAQFTYTTNNGTITIAAYTGSNSAVSIPSTIDDLPVTAIAAGTFQYSTNLNSIIIPGSVTNIGLGTFAFFYVLHTAPPPASGYTEIVQGSLTNITVDAANPVYSSLNGVLFDKNQTTLLDYPEGRSGNYTIPNGVSIIQDYAFYNSENLSNVTMPNSVTGIENSTFSQCDGLTHVAIGNSVTNIGYSAFGDCLSLTNVTISESVMHIDDFAFAYCPALRWIFFRGDAPSADSTVFSLGISPTIYYLSGTTGWADFPASYGVQTILWNPQTMEPGFGGNSGRFEFSITGTTNIPIVVEGCTNLASPWTILQSCTLTNGKIDISDPQWTNYSRRFYRIRSP